MRVVLHLMTKCNHCMKGEPFWVDIGELGEMYCPSCGRLVND